MYSNENLTGRVMWFNEYDQCWVHFGKILVEVLEYVRTRGDNDIYRCRLIDPTESQIESGHWSVGKNIVRKTLETQITHQFLTPVAGYESFAFPSEVSWEEFL